MSPRQISAFIEHGEALDRMEDARNLIVALVAGSGNEKEITKHFKAWADGRSPGQAMRNKKLTQADMDEVRRLRDLLDKRKSSAG